MMRMENLHSRNIGILTIHQNHGPQVWHNELRISCFHLDPPAGVFGQVVFSTEFPPFLHFNCWKCHTRADESRSVVYANGGRFFCFLFFFPCPNDDGDVDQVAYFPSGLLWYRQCYAGLFITLCRSCLPDSVGGERLQLRSETNENRSVSLKMLIVKYYNIMIYYNIKKIYVYNITL